LIQTFSTKSTCGFLQVILEFGCKNNINYASNPKFCEDFLRTSPYVSPTKGKRTGKEEVQAFPLEKHPPKIFSITELQPLKRPALKNMVFSADLILQIADTWPGTDWISPGGAGGSIHWHSAGRSAHPGEQTRLYGSKASTFGAARWPHR
jgi:hypothetical protein